MRQPIVAWFLVCLLSLCVATTAPAAEPKTRKFTFHYALRIDVLQRPVGAADLVRKWLPCPPTDDTQEVKRLDAIAPAKLTEHRELRYGNAVLYVETPLPADGELRVDVPYEVVRHEVLSAEKTGDAQRLAGDVIEPPDVIKIRGAKLRATQCRN